MWKGKVQTRGDRTTQSLPFAGWRVAGWHWWQTCIPLVVGRICRGLDWVGNRGTLGKTTHEVGLRQRAVQTSGTGREPFDRLVSEDFRDAVPSFLCCLLRGLTLFCGTIKQRNDIRDCLNRFNQTRSSVRTTIINQLVTYACDFNLVMHALFRDAIFTFSPCCVFVRYKLHLSSVSQTCSLWNWTPHEKQKVSDQDTDSTTLLASDIFIRELYVFHHHSQDRKHKKTNNLMTSRFYLDISNHKKKNAGWRREKRYWWQISWALNK